MSDHIQLSHVSLSFQLDNERISLFDELNVSFHQGQSYAITGPSGAGKSSLMLIASGLEEPSSGSIRVTSQQQFQPIEALRSEIGFIFQQFHLLSELTALNNVALPLKLRGDKHAMAKAEKWLSKVGLSHRANHKPSALSGGEQQRVAIARALVFDPKFIFADEPTGNLDPKNADEVADILISCCKDNNSGLILVTHSERLASRTQHIYELSQGQLITKHLPNEHLSPKLDIKEVVSC